MDGHVRRRHKRRLVFGSPGVAFADRFLRHTEHREEIILDRFKQLLIGFQIVPQRDMANEIRKTGSICTINVGVRPQSRISPVSCAPGLR